MSEQEAPRPFIVRKMKWRWREVTDSRSHSPSGLSFLPSVVCAVVSSCRERSQRGCGTAQRATSPGPSFPECNPPTLKTEKQGPVPPLRGRAGQEEAASERTVSTACPVRTAQVNYCVTRPGLSWSGISPLHPHLIRSGFLRLLNKGHRRGQRLTWPGADWAKLQGSLRESRKSPLRDFLCSQERGCWRAEFFPGQEED